MAGQEAFVELRRDDLLLPTLAEAKLGTLFGHAFESTRRLDQAVDLICGSLVLRLGGKEHGRFRWDRTIARRRVYALLVRRLEREEMEHPSIGLTKFIPVQALIDFARIKTQLQAAIVGRLVHMSGKTLFEGAIILPFVADVKRNHVV